MVKRLRDKSGFVYGWNKHMEQLPDLEVFDDETDELLEKESDVAKRVEEDRRIAADPDQHPDIQRNALANTNVPPDPGRNYEHQVGAAALGEGEGHGDYPEDEENIVPHQRVFVAVAPEALRDTELNPPKEGEDGKRRRRKPGLDKPEVPAQGVRVSLLEAAEQVKENPATDPEQGGGDKPVGTATPRPEKPANIVEPREGEEVPNQGVRLMISPDPKRPAEEEPEPADEDENGEPEPGGEDDEQPAAKKRVPRRKKA